MIHHVGTGQMPLFPPQDPRLPRSPPLQKTKKNPIYVSVDRTRTVAYLSPSYRGGEEGNIFFASTLIKNKKIKM